MHDALVGFLVEERKKKKKQETNIHSAATDIC